MPYLFHAALTTDNNSSLANDGKTLNMTITRKTTAELGLQGNSAAIYDSLSAAALNDDSFGAALMSLTTQDQVQDTLDTAVPDVAGGIKALVVSMTDQAYRRDRSTSTLTLLTAPCGQPRRSSAFGRRNSTTTCKAGRDAEPGGLLGRRSGSFRRCGSGASSRAAVMVWV